MGIHHSMRTSLTFAATWGLLAACSKPAEHRESARSVGASDTPGAAAPPATAAAPSPTVATAAPAPAAVSPSAPAARAPLDELAECARFVARLVTCAKDPSLLSAAVAAGGRDLTESHGGDAKKARAQLAKELASIATYGATRVCREFGGEGQPAWPFVGELSVEVAAKLMAGNAPSCADVGVLLHDNGFPILRGD